MVEVDRGLCAPWFPPNDSSILDLPSGIANTGTTTANIPTDARGCIL